MNVMKTVSAAAILLALVAGESAHAQSFDATHPRRAEVNGRLGVQNARIRAGVTDGQLSRRQARRLHADDRAIRAEERADASVNGGHITRGEQRQVNRQENANSRAIAAERRPY